MVAMFPCTPTDVGKVWNEWGITKAVMFGRFQPLHHGHRALIRAVRQTGFDLHIVVNGKVNTKNKKNPYSVRQKMDMFHLAIPEIPPENLHCADVYLGGGGDVGSDVRKLTKIFRSIAPDDQIVIPYARKTTDIKDFLVDGKTHENIHYVDLLTAPHGNFRQQVFAADMIPDYVDICATRVRNGKAPKETMDPNVKIYLAWQHAQAEANNRLVGADPRKDSIILPCPPQIAHIKLSNPCHPA